MLLKGNGAFIVTVLKTFYSWIFLKAPEFSLMYSLVRFLKQVSSIIKYTSSKSKMKTLEQRAWTESTCWKVFYDTFFHEKSCQIHRKAAERKVLFEKILDQHAKIFTTAILLKTFFWLLIKLAQLLHIMIAFIL